MMKNRITFLTIGLLLAGCNPFENQQDAVEQFIQDIDIKAKRIASQKEKNIELREIKPYVNYTYQSELSDPFRVREFIVDEEDSREDVVVERENPQRCLPPECRPPAPHPKSILEEFTLESLQYVGSFLQAGDNVALIATPTYGVVHAKKGDYLGMDNGRIVEVRDSLIIIQEKIRKNGLWKDKKSVLKIRR